MRKTLILILSLFSVLKSYSQCYGLVWADEFNSSSIDTTKWSYELGGGGWGNSELESYTARPQNSYVSNGNLYITALKETYTGADGITQNYTSARMATQTKADWTYGRFEVRAKLPKGEGLWPAIWMMPTYSEYGIWPSSGEIDIMELLGNDTTKVYGTMHYGASVAAHHYSGGNKVLASGFYGSFHVFSVEWDSTKITWMVDSVPYYSQTKAGIAPDNWPFNKDFFFILDVAVGGGGWAGTPDSTTQFPQSMIVDYVRVYQDMNIPSAKIYGKGSVFENESGVVYNVPQLASASYTWQVPSGAQLISGQGTNEIVVNWGNAGGAISVSYSTTCGNKTINLPVTVINNKCGLMFDDYENTREVAFEYASGTYQQQVANPAPDTVNASFSVGKYTRNSSSQYDVLAFLNYFIVNANDFKTGAKKFSMDVYSNVAGTTINLQLEYSPKDALAYPVGRHSLYTATTTKTNQWERLTFNFSQIIDASVNPDSINTVIFLFAPNTSASSTFYIDNFSYFNPGVCAGGITGINNISASQTIFTVYPNPASEQVTVVNNQNTSGQLKLVDLNGKIVYEIMVKGSYAIIPLTNIIPGLYFIEFYSENGVRYQKLAVE